MAKVLKIHTTLNVAAYNATQSAEAARAALRKAMVKGELPKDRAQAYKIGVVASILNFGDSPEGFEKARTLMEAPEKTLTTDQVAAKRAAANRLKRRLNELDVASADNRGRPRGAQVTKAGEKAAASAAEGEVVDAKGVPARKGGAVVPATFTGVPVPKCASVEEFDAVITGAMAFLQTARKASPKGVDAANNAALMAMTAAVETLRAARRDGDFEPDH